MTQKETELFETRAVPSAVLSMVAPAVVSQIVMVLYNMADTFFIGQTGDPNQVAAANICMPLSILLCCFANLFGIGGSGLISRSLGMKNERKAKNTASFALWTAVCAAACYGIIAYSLRGKLLHFIGANSETYEYCSTYMFWVVAVGAVPSVMNLVLGHLVRAEGFSKQASIGMITGALLNIVLDPVFITVLNLQIAGAAIATMLSNCVAVIYFLFYLIPKQGKTVVVLNPKYYSVSDKIPSEVILTGLPGALMNIMETLSNVVLNRLMGGYCNEAIAGVGIAKKIDLISFGISMGVSQGVVPLVGYNYASKNYSRMKKIIVTTFIMGFGIAAVFTVFLFTCAEPVVRAFISDPLTVEYGRTFQRIICITGPCIPITLIVVTFFQAVGKKIQPLLLSMLRKGLIDIPFMFLLNAAVGVYGIVWAIPIADCGAMCTALLMFICFIRKLNKNTNGLI